MDFVKYTPWLAPLIMAAMVTLTVTLRPPAHNTGQSASNTTSR